MKYITLLCFLIILTLDMCFTMEEIAVESNGLAEKRTEKRGIFGLGYGSHGGYYGGGGSYGFGHGGGYFGGGHSFTYPLHSSYSSHIPSHGGYRSSFYH